MKKNMLTPEQVKSTVNALECSPSKNAPNSTPVYVHPGKGGAKSGGGGGFKKGK